MKHELNFKFLRSVSIFTAANFINAAIPFLLLPVLTKYLTPADFGIVSMFQVLTNIVLPFSGLNADGAVSRYYFERDKIDFSKFVSGAVLILLASTLAVCIVFFFASGTIKEYSFGEEAVKIGTGWLFVVILLAMGQNLMQIQLNIWQVQHKALQFGLLRIAKTIVEIGFSVFLIIQFKKSWEGRMNAQLIAVSLFALLSLYFLLKEKFLKPGISKAYIKTMLQYGAPLVPHILSGVIITYSDRIFITNMVSLSDTGLYSVGYQIGMVISLLQTSFNQAWVPWFFEKLKIDAAATKLKIVKFTYIYYVLMIVLALLLTFSAPLIFKIFIGKEYSSGIVYVFWIALGFAFNGMYKMVVNYIFYLNKTYIIAAMTVVTASLNICLNYFLIKRNGAVGAAQATAISFLFEFILVWIVSAKLYKMPWLFFLKKNN